MSLPILNPYLAEFSYPKNPENMRPHTSNSRHNTNPCSHTSHKNDTSSTDTSSLPYSWEVIPPSPCIGTVFLLRRNLLRSSMQIPNKANQSNSPYRYVYSVQFKDRRPTLYQKKKACIRCFAWKTFGTDDVLNPSGSYIKILGGALRKLSWSNFK